MTRRVPPSTRSSEKTVNAITYDQRGEGWDAPPEDGPLPRRPRRQLFNKRSAALIAVITCAAGFYAGVRVEKGQTSSTSSGGSSLASAIAAARGGTAGSSSTAGDASRGRTAGGLGALFAGGGFGGAGGGGTSSLGRISSVNGNSLFVITETGNVVKVKLSSATKISKSLGVSRSALHPGDTVVIRGLTGSNGTMTATSVSDQGATASTLGSGGSGAGSGSSASSAVSSLFSGGASGAAGSSGAGSTAGAGTSGGGGTGTTGGG